MPLLAITRFTNETYYENAIWRKENDWSGCIYGSPKDIICTTGEQLIVVEMNNDENKIIGIGIIRNQPDYTKKYNIYKYGYYNRKVFIGKRRIDVSDIKHDILLDAIKEMEKILFYGKTHYKRGLGVQILKSDLIMKHPTYSFTTIFRDMFREMPLSCADYVTP
jgi:hypothetical protein